MNDREANVLSTEDFTTTPDTLPKVPSWSRNPRTSCDLCKRMKIRCQRRDDESCARCVARKLNCTTTQVERKKPRLAREPYLHDMEDRIKRMESVISFSRLQDSAELAKVKEEERSFPDEIESQAGLSNHLSNLIIDPKGSPSFIGWASGFSLLSPQGLQWISEKVGDKDEIAQLVRTMSNYDLGVWGRAEVDVWCPMPRSQHSPLPSKDLALKYVDYFFVNVNNVFPVLNQKVFKSYFDRQYSTSPPADTAWYALFNAVLCLGSIQANEEREMHKRSSHLVDYTAIGNETGVNYFCNANSCFLDLLLKEANLMAMQAMTLLLFITTSSPNPQPAYVIASAAGNLANTLGLHRRSNGFGLTQEESEQRKNVFWVFYLMEKAISRNLGRPSVINDDDIAIDLPPKQPRLIQSPSGEKVYDVFQDQIVLAIIGSRIYSELYSARSQTKSEMERMKVLGKLDDHLQSWRDSIPVDIRPERPIKCSDEQYVSVVMMHFTYLDLVILLHRISDHQQSLKDGEATDTKSQDQRLQLNPGVYASQLLCLAAARRSVQLLDTLKNNSPQNQRLMWLALYYPLSASLILFANILSNPQDQHAASDVHLMSVITSFIAHSVQPGTSFAVTPTLHLAKELHGIAARLVARIPLQLSQKMKKLHGIDEPAQPDFVSSSGVRLATDMSLCSNLNTQTTKSVAPHDAPTTCSNIDIPATGSSPTYSSQQIPQGDQDIQSTASAQRSQKSTSTLDFAPFVPSEASQFDYNSTMYDPLLSPSRFEWDMASMWMPNFASDPFEDYFDGNEDGNNMYQ